ncbi:hypothetical protein CMQ_5586 [Grosmannia clavigera kw1407]|uniref:Uncharacterized protein n=1 Tax=Grosmannia clavigera (strain kw1407 / UAMH 11150) TaxID=655863 RepID=F0XSX2_GROCL|nr:uncharacterized protein CMQ_5586 [Grosmannia clavigera kw1407]EFW99165.1 hypothetical protein CMQ_5586 [Grosmannia clavigera kw1407]
MIRSWTNLSLQTEAIDVDSLQVLAAFVNQSLDINLPCQSTAPYWGGLCPPKWSCPGLEGTTTDMGTFSYITWKYKVGLLANSVNHASSRNSSMPPQYPKLDNTGFVFNGRSYGVASTVGLASLTQQDAQGEVAVQGFSFHEYGYLSNVFCTYNRKSKLSLEVLNQVTVSGGDVSPPDVVWATGSLPTGHWQGFPFWGVGTDTMVALAAVGNNDTDQFAYGFVAGNFYAVLNQAQCAVTFTPTLFHVDVDMGSKNITVTPEMAGSRPVVDIDPSRALTNVSFLGISYMSATLTTLYTSVFGDGFVQNIDNVRARENHTTNTSADALASMSEGLELLLDQFLGSTGAAQLMLCGDTQSVEANVAIQVVKLGGLTWVILSLAATSLIAIGVVAAALCTRYWRGLTVYNIFDLKSAILGATTDKATRHWNGNAKKRCSVKVEGLSNRPMEALLANYSQSTTFT